MKQGIWLLPTRRRIEKLRQFIEACGRTGMTTPLLILVNENELIEMWDEYSSLPLPACWALCPTKAEGLGDKVREQWPAVRNLDWCGLIVDDVIPHTYLWDRLMIEQVNGKNVVSCDDGKLAPARMAGCVIWGGELMRSVGYMFPPGFWHTYVDNVWEDLGNITGCWDIRMDVLITHDHGFEHVDGRDETFQRSYEKNSEDELAYAEWRMLEFMPAIKRISEMQGFEFKLPKSKRSFFDKVKSLIYNPRVAEPTQGVRP